MICSTWKNGGKIHQITSVYQVWLLRVLTLTFFTIVSHAELFIKSL